MKLSKILVILLSIMPNLAFARSSNFDTLRYMIQVRTLEPKIYLPNQGYLGKDLTVLVKAPQAKAVRLFAAKDKGQSELDGSKLKLSSDFYEIGKVELDGERANAEFQVDLNFKKYKELQDKFLYFEALIDYENDDGSIVTKTASFFGPNAAFSNVNAVRIMETPKDHSQSAALARSFIPGLSGGGQGGGF